MAEKSLLEKLTIGAAVIAIPITIYQTHLTQKALRFPFEANVQNRQIDACLDFMTKYQSFWREVLHRPEINSPVSRVSDDFDLFVIEAAIELSEYAELLSLLDMETYGLVVKLFQDEVFGSLSSLSEEPEPSNYELDDSSNDNSQMAYARHPSLTVAYLAVRYKCRASIHGE
ncbi:MAG: hypothetical protein AAF382_06720 [Pseudomonadota bacterium]